MQASITMYGDLVPLSGLITKGDTQILEKVIQAVKYTVLGRGLCSYNFG